MARFWPFGKKQRKQARAFQGALTSRLTGDWVTANSASQDSEIRGSLSKLRNRSRDLVRNNDYARQAIRTIRNNVVGQGVQMQSQVRQPRTRRLETAINDAIESKWVEWQRKDSCHVGGTLSFADIERLLISSVAESGEVFVRIVRQQMGRSRVPLALQIIESDMLDENYNARASNGNEIRMSIERDAWGRPQAYHVLQNHPGDYTFGAGASPRVERIRIPADEMIHLYITERPDQSRGIPWLSAAISRIHQMQGYEQYEVVAARATAALMGFIETPEGELPAEGEQNGQAVTDFEPGVFKQLNPGERVVVPQLNRPGNQFEPFMRVMLRGISASCGISFESLSRDYSQSNYSSSRLSLLEDRDHWRVLQSWLISNLHQRVFEEFLEMATLSGALSLPGYEIQPERYQSAARWLPRGWAFVDPVKEVAAYKEAIKAGFITVADVVAQSGGDFEEIMTQRQREIEFAESLGVELDTTVVAEQPHEEQERPTPASIEEGQGGEE